MVHLSRIYTRTGDAGMTRLVGGAEIPKDDARIEAYGTVDELSATLGLVRSALNGEAALDGQVRDDLDAWLHGVQQRLFDLGSDLATRSEDRYEGQPRIEKAHVETLEAQIDRWNDELEPLGSFVLPGGGPTAAHLHLARTVCRRAERITIRLGHNEAIGDQVIPWLNRLSDALFVASRWASSRAGTPEALWEY